MNGLLQVQDEVDKLDKIINEMIEATQMIKHFSDKFPDMVLYRPANDRTEYIMCSSTVNSYVDDYDIFERTEVEGGVALERIDVWPFVAVEDHKIYSNPPCFTVGTINKDGFGTVPAIDWDTQMDSDNISHTVSRKIRTYLKSKPPIFYLTDVE